MSNSINNIMSKRSLLTLIHTDNTTISMAIHNAMLIAAGRATKYDQLTNESTILCGSASILGYVLNVMAEVMKKCRGMHMLHARKIFNFVMTRYKVNRRINRSNYDYQSSGESAFVTMENRANRAINFLMIAYDPTNHNPNHTMNRISNEANNIPCPAVQARLSVRDFLVYTYYIGHASYVKLLY